MQWSRELLQMHFSVTILYLYYPVIIAKIWDRALCRLIRTFPVAHNREEKLSRPGQAEGAQLSAQLPPAKAIHK